MAFIALGINHKTASVEVRERVASSTGGRGHVDLQSAPGRGTTVRICLPLTL